MKVRKKKKKLFKISIFTDFPIDNFLSNLLIFLTVRKIYKHMHFLTLIPNTVPEVKRIILKKRVLIIIEENWQRGQQLKTVYFTKNKIVFPAHFLLFNRFCP